MAPDWLRAATAVGGETGRLARTYDWSRSPLGPVDSWPEEMRVAVGLCFSTRFPVFVTWGPDLAMVYNDGYRQMLGTDKHPRAWGAPMRAVWPEIWQDVGPYVDQVLTSGEATWVVDQPLVMNRSGFTEETTFTYSYGPLRDHDGIVRGLLAIAYETTSQVVGRRRLATVGDLSAALQGLAEPADVVRVALERLADAADITDADLYVDGAEGPVPHGRETSGRPATSAEEALVREVARTSSARVVLPDTVIAPVGPGSGTAADAVLVLRGNPRRPFDEEHREFLLLIARTIGTALTSASRTQREIGALREVSDALQAAMLPVVPSSDRVEARYRPAEGAMAVGGDWYDVVELAPGRRALLVGDCVGHGLQAAAVMGQLRSAGRALLLENSSPAAVVRSLDAFALRLPGAECTTVFCAIVDEASGVLTYSSAGHPPALLLTADGHRWLEEALAPPLAVQPGPRPEAHVAVADGDTLLLYTDGLVERRDESLDDGLRRLELNAAGLRTAAVDATTVDVLLAALLPDGAADDVAVLLYRVGRAGDRERGAQAATVLVGG